MDAHKLFEYREGALYWRVNRRGGPKAGDRAGYLMSGRYWYVRFGGRLVQEHRIIWEMHNGPIADGLCVDHINENKHDNRIENLQLLTKADNTRKHVSTVQSLPVGVQRHGVSRYRAVAQGKRYLGIFGTVAEAVAALEAA